MRIPFHRTVLTLLSYCTPVENGLSHCDIPRVQNFASACEPHIVVHLHVHGKKAFFSDYTFEHMYKVNINSVRIDHHPPNNPRL